MNVQIEPYWKKHLASEFEKPYFKTLTSFVKQEYQTQQIYPPRKLIFNAFTLCPFNEVKVVIIGQDPYHGSGQAHGLCFSVMNDTKIPPSLRNIFKEINQDIGTDIPSSGNLERWAKQGVLLLNATLTVRDGQAASHQKKGWETFTDETIKELSKKREGIVFLLWGAYAQKKAEMIDSQKHLILKSAHPSPLSASRGFFGNHHFSRTNTYLQNSGKRVIKW